MLGGMKTYPITCTECQSDFSAPRQNAKYCSEKCRADSKKNRSLIEATCLHCGEDFKFPRYKPDEVRKYCSRSCAAIVNNALYPKRQKEIDEATERALNTCPLCGNKKNKLSNHCMDCHLIQLKVKTQKRIDSWYSGDWHGGENTNTHLLSSVIRVHLLEKANNACIKCGFNTPHPDDGKSILEINHIDGNGSNHLPNNLEVLCPNCHALTSSYRARNYGKGRPYRYKLKP